MILGDSVTAPCEDEAVMIFSAFGSLIVDEKADDRATEPEQDILNWIQVVTIKYISKEICEVIEH